MKEIPWFSARKLNYISDYDRFHHTRSYLRQRSACYPSPSSDPAIMTIVGYRKAAKFSNHRKAWDALRRRVPLAYLEAIGASLDVFAVAAEADQQEWEAALALPLYPRDGIERMIPSIYRNFPFPVGTSEAEAISIALDRSRRTGHECAIHCIGLKTVYTNPAGEVSTIFYKPTLKINGGFLVARSDGSRVGTCRMGR